MRMCGSWEKFMVDQRRSRRFVKHVKHSGVLTVLCKSNESEFRRNSSFVLTNFQRNFERYFVIFLPKFEALSKKIRVVNRKVTKANEISMKQKFEGAKYRRIFAEEIVPQDKHLHV